MKSKTIKFTIVEIILLKNLVSEVETQLADEVYKKLERSL